MPGDLPYLDFSAPGFSTRGKDVAKARAMSWCARTNLGLAVLRHREAGLLLRDRRLRQGSHAWPDTVGLNGSFAEFWRRSIISCEGAQHKQLRLLAQSALSKDFVLGLSPGFSEISESLIRDLRDRDTFEFMSAFSEPFAGQAIAFLLGLGPELAPPIARNASTLGLAMGLAAKDHETAVNDATDSLMRLAGDLVRRVRSGRDRTSYVARLVQLFDENQVRDETALLDLVVISIFGGVDTTRAQLGLAIGLFVDHPVQWQMLRRDPALIPSAIEEAIRTRPTTTWSTREALETFSFGGITVREGETVHILVHATSRDPMVTADQRFDVTCRRKMHFGFGGGAHHCLGQFVARTDMGEALRAMTRHWSELGWAGKPDWLPESGNTGPVRLPIRVVWS